MKKLFIVLLVLLLSACTPAEEVKFDPVATTVCIPSSNLDFYSATVTTVLGGTKDAIMLETAFGDIEIDDQIYEYTVLDVYSHLCIETLDDVAIKFVSARQKDIDIPEPPTVYVDVPGPTVEVLVEVPVYTHDLIDPDVWIATDHPVYYYYIQPDIAHIVYTTAPTEEDNFTNMFIVSIVFSEGRIFSSKVMVASIVYMNLGYYEGGVFVETELTNTSFETLDEFILDFIANHTYGDIVTMYDIYGR